MPLYTYLCSWDTLVSFQRAYSERELYSLVAKVKGNKNYVWEFYRASYKDIGPFPLYWFKGTPDPTKYRTKYRELKDDEWNS